VTHHENILFPFPENEDENTEKQFTEQDKHTLAVICRHIQTVKLKVYVKVYMYIER